MSSSSTKMGAASTASSGVVVAAHHPKVERKLMEEKIAKVREVVKNISTNDIVLALHNFELDVARTIHAFCEGGSQSALGDWEKTGAAKKRNNKKKAKSSVAQPQSDVIDGHSTGKLTKGTFGTSSISSSISSATTFSTNNGFPSSNFNGTVAAANATHHPPPPSSMLNGGSGVVDSMSSNGANLKQNGLPPTEQQPFLMMNGTKPRVDSDQTMLPETFGGRPTMAPIGSKEVFAAPVDPPPSSGIGDNEAHLERNKSLFEQEVVYAQENIQRCFKEVQEALRQREQHLLGELVDSRQAGLAYFASRAGLLQKMSSTTTSKAQQQQLLEKFNEAKTEDLECALTGRFLFEQADLAGIVQSVGQFGRVIPVKMATAQAMAKKVEPSNASASSTRPLPQNAGQMRRSNSPSSLVSSIDSGLGGQISPVNQEKAAVAQMDEGGGIVLKSDHISADQLAEIQRNILDSLKAKGIDPAMLAQINATSTLTAPRRRQPPTPRNGDGHNQKGGGGSNGAQQQHGRQHQRGNGPNKGTGGGAGGGQGVQGGQQQQQAKKQANKTGGTGNVGTSGGTGAK